MIRDWMIAVVLSLLFALCACSTDAIHPGAPTRISPAVGLGGIVGKIKDTSLWQRKPVYVYAAPFFGDSEGKGIYALEPSLHPRTVLEAEGIFQLNNISPGAYVLVVGTNPQEAQPITKEGRPWIIRVFSDQVVDIGIVETEP